MTHSIIMMVQSMELSTKQNSSNNSNDNNQQPTQKVKGDVGKEASMENKKKLISYLLYIQRIPHV